MIETNNDYWIDETHNLGHDKSWNVLSGSNILVEQVTHVHALALLKSLNNYDKLMG